MIFRTFNSEIDKSINKIGLFNKSFTTMGRDLKAGNGLFTSVFSNSVTSNDIKCIEAMNVAMKNGTSLARAWTDNMSSATVAAKQQVAQCIKNKESLDILTSGLKSSTLSAKAATVAMKALSIAGNMLIMWAVTKGIELAVKWLDKLVHSAEYAEKAIKAATDSAKSFSNTIKDIQKETVDMEKSVDSIIDRYAKLLQGVNAFTNENKSLPTDQYEEFLGLNKQLTELFPSLTRNYDENGNAILGLSGSVDSVTESIRALVEQEKELAKSKIRENLEGYFDGTDEADGAWKALEGRKQKLEEANEALTTLKKTYEGLINADTSVVLGQYYKDWVYRERSKYLKYIKNNFGEDIADAMKDAVSVNLGTGGFTGELADLVVDFSGLELTATQKEQIARSYDTFYSELLAKQKTAISEFNSQNSEFSNNALLWLEDLSFYKDSDKYIQTAIQNIVRNIDWSSYDFKELDYDGVKRILQDSVLTPFQVACDDPDTKKSLEEALKNLFTLDTTDMSIDDAANLVNQYIRTISGIINKDQIELKVRLGFDDIDALEDNYLTMLNEVSTRVSGIEIFDPRYVTEEQSLKYSEIYHKIDEFAKQYSINTQDEIAAFRKALEEANYDIEKAFENYLATEVTEESPNFFTQLNNSKESLDKFQSSVKSAYDAYSTLLSGSYSSNELLDSIQAINQAMSDIGSEIQWESMFGGGIGLAQVQETLEREFQKYAESILRDAGIEIGSDFGQMLAHNIVNAQKASTQLEVLNDQIDSLQSAYSDLTDIVKTYNKTGYITFDQLQKLLAMEPQYLSCLIDENGQLQLNEQAMVALAEQRLIDAKAQAVNQAIVELGELAYKNEKVALDASADSFEREIDVIADYNEALATAIAETSVMIDEINNLNAAIMGAEENGASEDQVNTIVDNLYAKWKFADTVMDQLKNGGLGSVMKSSSSTKDFEETFDYFERRVDVLDDALSLLKTDLDNVTGAFAKNNLIDAELGLTEEKFKNYSDALNMYTQKANEALSKLPSDIAQQVRNGAVALTDFIGDGNKDVVDAIKDYESWANKIADCQQELAELKTAIRQLELEKFNNIIKDFTNQFDLRENGKDLISKQIDLLKEAGELIGESFFITQIDQSKKQLALLEEEKAQLVNQMSSALSSGRVKCCPAI